MKVAQKPRECILSAKKGYFFKEIKKFHIPLGVTHIRYPDYLDMVSHMSNNPRYVIKKVMGEVDNKDNEKPRCKHCHSLNIIKYGKVREKQQFKCKRCGHRFFNDDCFVGMRTPKKAIALGIELYFSGLSLRKVQTMLRKIYGVKVSRKTIWKWLLKYSELVKDFTSDLRPELSKLWHVDETVIKVRGQTYWLWQIIDSKTRFLVASHFSKTRTTVDGVELFQESARISKGMPEYITADKLPAYPQAIRKAFNVKKKDIHFQGNTAITDKVSNNMVERLNGTVKDRTRVMRGLKNPETASVILKGFSIYYNYLREHESLGMKTPAIASKVDLPFEDGWGDLIQWATIYKTLRQLKPKEEGVAIDLMPT